MKINYETPDLTEAKFGKFVQGSSAIPGGDSGADSQTGDY